MAGSSRRPARPASGRDPAESDAAIERARQHVAAARRIVALTGAGISTESGIPDFRGPQGLWTKNPEAEKMATLQVYMSDPQVRARAWQQRLDPANWRAEPNAGHAALVELERRGRLDTLITQNVDGLHQKAGNDPARVIEIHGTIHEVMCMRCGARWPVAHALGRVRAGERDPHCERCGGILKTATISFGQSLVREDLERAFAAAAGCDLLLAVGSTLAVQPVAGVVPEAKQSGARIVIVNGEPTEMDALADVVVRGRIGAVLPRIVGAARERREPYSLG